MDYFFSIICPIYNSEKFLDETLLSVIKQTYRNFEFILLDDGSTDNSKKIINKYLSDKRLRFFENDHIGPFLEREYGIRVAKGDYILFIDSDDIYGKNLLVTLNDLLKKSENLNMLIYKYSKFSNFFVNNFDTDVKFENVPLLGFDYSCGSLCRCCIRKEILDLALPLIPDYLKNNRYMEDYLLVSLCASFCDKICMIDNVYYYYRENLNSITHSLNFNDAFGAFRNCDYLNEYLYLNGKKNFSLSEHRFFYVYRPIFMSIADKTFFKKKNLVNSIRKSFTFNVLIPKYRPKSLTYFIINTFIKFNFTFLLFVFIKTFKKRLFNIF